MPSQGQMLARLRGPYYGPRNYGEPWPEGKPPVATIERSRLIPGFKCMVDLSMEWGFSRWVPAVVRAVDGDYISVALDPPGVGSRTNNLASFKERT